MRSRNFLLSIMLVALVLAGCVPIRSSPPWIEDEVTIFGAKEDIRKLLLELPKDLQAQLAIEPTNPQPDAEFDLTVLVGELLAGPPPNKELSNVFDGFFDGRPTNAQLKQRIVAQRYRFKSKAGNDILQFIASVDAIRGRSTGEGTAKYFRYFVFAEPNFWLTSLSNVQKCVSLSGQPNSFGNGPFGDGVASLGAVADFNQQWAFQLLANTSTPEPDPLSAQTASEGQDPVDVYIYDNSPFTINETETGTGSGEDETVALAPGQTMKLKVWHWTTGNQPTLPATDSDDHGVFIASLIHKVAPNSSIKLIRVLDGSGCGAAYAFNNAIAAVAQGVNAGQKVVFNLSLGIPASKIDLLPKMYLEIVLTNYLAVKNIITVAAAGNDHGAPLLLPAGYVDDPAYSPYVKVVAVEASNSKGALACFSNKGTHTILAPGGEGDMTQSACSPNLSACTDQKVCEQAIMGVIHDGQNDGHYIFWSGTSFATPLVSGTAARWLSQGCSSLNVSNYFAQTNPPPFNLKSLNCPSP